MDGWMDVTCKGSIETVAITAVVRGVVVELMSEISGEVLSQFIQVWTGPVC